MIARLPARHREGTKVCEARVGWRTDEWGQHPTFCRQSRGLRTMQSEVGGDVHYFCAAPHHWERVIRHNLARGQS